MNLLVATALTTAVALLGWIILRIHRWTRQRRVDGIQHRTNIAYGHVLRASLGSMRMNGGTHLFRSATMYVELESSTHGHAQPALEITQSITNADAFAARVGARVEVRWSADGDDPQVSAASGPTPQMVPLTPAVVMGTWEFLLSAVAGTFLMITGGLGVLADTLYGDVSRLERVIAFAVGFALILGPFMAALWPLFKARRLGPTERFARLPGPDRPLAWITYTHANNHSRRKFWKTMTLAVQPVAGHAASFQVVQLVPSDLAVIACGGIAVELAMMGPGQPPTVTALLVPAWRESQFFDSVRDRWTGMVTDPTGNPCRRYDIVER